MDGLVTEEINRQETRVRALIAGAMQIGLNWHAKTRPTMAKLQSKFSAFRQEPPALASDKSRNQSKLKIILLYLHRG